MAAVGYADAYIIHIPFSVQKYLSKDGEFSVGEEQREMFHARLCICHYIRLTSKSNPTRNTL
jgi:hypothetical protein